MTLAQITNAYERIAFGNVPGASALFLNGYNGSVGSSFVSLWDPNTAYAFLTANMSSPTIVSSSANDAAAGTGARTVTISGVDSSYATQTETVTLNGVGAVSLTKNYMMINSIVVATAGSGGVPAGNLTLAAGGVTHGYVLAGRNQSTGMLYCTDANKGLLVVGMDVGNGPVSTGGNRYQWVYSTNKGLSFLNGFRNTTTQEKSASPYYVPIYFPPKTQIQYQCLAAGTGGLISGCAYCILLDVSTGTSHPSYERWVG